VADEPAQSAPVAERKERDGIPWRMVALGAIALYGVLLVILNSHETKVNFVFWSTRASLVVVLVLALGIGFLGGFLFDTARERRKRARASSSS
jgi:uncharacterized integral membrane protein